MVKPMLGSFAASSGKTGRARSVGGGQPLVIESSRGNHLTTAMHIDHDRYPMSQFKDHHTSTLPLNTPKHTRTTITRSTKQFRCKTQYHDPNNI